MKIGLWLVKSQGNQYYNPDVWQSWKVGRVGNFNPLSPNSVQHQTSPCNINAYSTPEVMRLKDMITECEFS